MSFLHSARFSRSVQAEQAAIFRAKPVADSLHQSSLSNVVGSFSKDSTDELRRTRAGPGRENIMRRATIGLLAVTVAISGGACDRGDVTAAGRKATAGPTATAPAPVELANPAV